MDLQKMVSNFYKNYLEKLIDILLPLDFTLLMAKLTIKLFAK